jgi:hypothetical protein
VAEKSATLGSASVRQVAPHVTPLQGWPSETLQACCVHHCCSAGGAQPHDTPGWMQHFAEASAHVNGTSAASAAPLLLGAACHARVAWPGATCVYRWRASAFAPGPEDCVQNCTTVDLSVSLTSDTTDTLTASR